MFVKEHESTPTIYTNTERGKKKKINALAGESYGEIVLLIVFFFQSRFSSPPSPLAMVYFDLPAPRPQPPLLPPTDHPEITIDQPHD